MKQLDEAISFAVRVHAGKFDKAGFPFIAHPFRVMQSLHFAGEDETMLVAAMLHDTVEDTPAELSDIRRQFGEDVCHLVDAATRRKSETYAEYIERIRLSGPHAIALKLADIRDNTDPRRPAIPGLSEKYARATVRLLS